MPPIPKTYTRLSRQLIFAAALVTLVFLLAYAPVTPVSSMGGAGTGPGGVGATDGSGTLEVWYQSDKTVYSDTSCTTAQTADNGTVACWPDHSGNTFEATSSVSGEQPTLQNGSGETWNGNRVINWDGDDILVTTDNVTLGPLTVFIVYNASEIGYLYVHSPNVGAPNDGSYIYSDVTGSYSVRRSSTEGYEDLNTDWGINATPRIITHHYNGTIATHSLFVNGAVQTPNLDNGNSPGTLSTSTIFSIGERRDNRFFPLTGITGNFAEVIAFNEYLNAAQRVLVENYLQAKFNDSVANNITISNDFYDGDTTTNGDFDLDVAGIGRATSTETHTEAHSVGMIVQNNTFLQDDGDYLMFGHLTSTNSNVATDLPGGWGADARRWARHWYIDVTDVGGITGTVNIIFDFSEGGMGGGSNPVGPVSNYHLLGRSGTSGAFSSVTTASSISGDQVIFTGVSVGSLGSNFTLGSENAVTSPTVVEMQSAAANTPSTFTFLTALTLLTLGAGTVLKLRRRV